MKEGASFSLSRDAEKEKAADNPVPFVHEMTRTGVNSANTSSGDKLIGYWDYGSSVTLTTGQTFTVDFGASLFTVA